MNKKTIDVIIIGAGVAGMTAALYARRNGKSVLMIEREQIGGQISRSPRVENYPSHSSISGNALSDKLFEQVTDLGADFELDDVKSLEKVDGVFEVTCEYGTYYGLSCIIASGVKQRMTGVDGELELVGKGISYCALCDGAFFAGEEVTLIGDANSALSYALLLSTYCTKVKIFTMFDKFFAEDYLVKALMAKDNIEITHEAILQEFHSNEDGLTGMTFKDKAGKLIDVQSRGLFIAIGHVPDNDKYAHLVNLDKNGYFDADEDCKTKTDGLFVAGDCRAKKVRQVLTAMSDGATASTHACTYVDIANK